jgi:hypothetical protein
MEVLKRRFMTMKKFGLVLLILGLVAVGFGIYGFIKVGSDGQLFDLLIKGAKELGAKVSGLDAFAMINRTWLTIAGGVAALAGGVMAFKKA